MIKLIRGIPVTVTLIILNIIMFLIAEIMGGSKDVGVMIKMGASYAPFITEGKEYYRLFTCMFLHFGIGHLFNNMLLLFFLGEILESTIGKMRFAVIYLLGGLIANVVSLWVDLRLTPDMMPVSAGASGAVFAIIGAILCVLVLDRGRMPSLTIQRFILMIVLALWQGFTGESVDNAAHVGGLIAGFGMALVLYKRTVKPPINEDEMDGHLE